MRPQTGNTHYSRKLNNITVTQEERNKRNNEGEESKSEKEEDEESKY